MTGTDGTRMPPFEMRICGSEGAVICFSCVVIDTGVPAWEIEGLELVECDSAIGRAGVAGGGGCRTAGLVTTICRIGTICC